MVGTQDLGVWHFKEHRSLSPQEFEFRNSIGFGLGLDYGVTNRVSIGLHGLIARTNFRLGGNGPGTLPITRDHTSHHQIFAEFKYVGRPGKSFQPFIGGNVGVLFTRDIRLQLDQQTFDFTFIDPGIYGFVLGFDHTLGANGWSIHLIIRGQQFEYTTLETEITYEQRLLDQTWWQNFNHIQLGISKKL